MPSVVGSGRGDVEEVLRAGEVLQELGYPVYLFVLDPGPKRWLEDASYDWERFPRVDRPVARQPRALTVTSQFGVTASDRRDEPLGAPGPWTTERIAVERSYGPDRTLHLSLEEFARTIPGRRHSEERHREAGRTSRERARLRNGAAARREADEFRRLYRKFRDLDRPNLLTIFPTFRRSDGFAREFPETVQCGPLWPKRRRARPALARRGRDRRVLWYARPSTSERLLPGIVRGLGALPGRSRLLIRSPRPFSAPSIPKVRVRFLTSGSSSSWSRSWGSADLRVVTGSRSLLEALVEGRPFLYFNGILGVGRSARRHRPEKIDALLDVWRSWGVDDTICRDLSDFARGRRVERVIARAAGDPRWQRGLPRALPVRGFAGAFRSAEQVLGEVARRFSEGQDTAQLVARAVRAESRAPSALARASRNSKA